MRIFIRLLRSLLLIMPKRLRLTIKYGESPHLKITKYPDGQQNVTLDLEYFNNPRIKVDIYCTIRNWHEMELLLAALSALRQADYIVHDINIAYLFGMRSDRIFELGMGHYWRDVVVPILQFICVTYKVTLRFLQLHGRCENYLNDPHIYYHSLNFNIATKLPIAGDKSAISIIEGYEHFWGREDKVIHFTKKRQSTGEIEIHLPERFVEKIEQSELPLIIMDDLCDGGATFIAEADILRDLFPDKKIELFIYHGLFTKGIEHVARHFDRIYMTNSYQEIVHPKVKLLKVI